jgi:hypothetical protein
LIAVQIIANLLAVGVIWYVKRQRARRTAARKAKAGEAAAKDKNMLELMADVGSEMMKSDKLDEQSLVNDGETHNFIHAALSFDGSADPPHTGKYEEVRARADSSDTLSGSDVYVNIDRTGSMVHIFNHPNSTLSLRDIDFSRITGIFSSYLPPGLAGSNPLKKGATVSRKNGNTLARRVTTKVAQVFLNTEPELLEVLVKVKAGYDIWVIFVFLNLLFVFTNGCL